MSKSKQDKVKQDDSPKKVTKEKLVDDVKVKKVPKEKSSDVSKTKKEVSESKDTTKKTKVAKEKSNPSAGKSVANGKERSKKPKVEKAAPVFEFPLSRVKRFLGQVNSDIDNKIVNLKEEYKHIMDKVTKEVEKVLSETNQKGPRPSLITTFEVGNKYPEYQEYLSKFTVLNSARVRFSNKACAIFSMVAEEMVKSIVVAAAWATHTAKKKKLTVASAFEAADDDKTLLPLYSCLSTYLEEKEERKKYAYETQLEYLRDKLREANISMRKKNLKEVKEKVIPKDDEVESTQSMSFKNFVSNIYKRVLQQDELAKHNFSVSLTFRDYLAGLVSDLFTVLSHMSVSIANILGVRVVHEKTAFCAVQNLIIINSKPEFISTTKSMELPTKEFLEKEKARRLECKETGKEFVSLPYEQCEKKEQDVSSLEIRYTGTGCNSLLTYLESYQDKMDLQKVQRSKKPVA